MQPEVSEVLRDQREWWPIRLVLDHLATPRVILFSFGVLMLAISAATYYQEPDYLVFPWLYTVTAGLGMVACWVSVAVPNKWTLALAGALIAGACAARGIGLMMTVVTSPWRGDVSWTFIVGSLAYLVILSMLPPVWVKHLIPWTVEKVR